MLRKFAKKPVIVGAIEWDGSNTKEILDFCPKAIDDVDYILIPTLEGIMKARKGDFIIKGVKGECYPCKPDIFWMTYDEVGA